MKLNKILIALGLAGALVGMAHAATPTPISKSITLTAQINDAIFVSKPDGSSWYGTEELEAKDYKQQEFTKTLPIRVWSRSADFHVSLAQPLQLSNGAYQMTDTTVALTQATGEQSVQFGSQLKVTQVLATPDGFDEVHNLKISVKAPTKPASSSLSTNGSYSGNLVLVFEPT